MCLDTLTVIHRQPRPEVVTGFKVFRRHARTVGARTEAVLTFEYHHHFRMGRQRLAFGSQGEIPINFPEVPYRRWLTAIQVRLFARERNYQSGFHVFTNEKDAWQWCGNNHTAYAVVPVQCRNVTARGTLALMGCFVAQQIRIPA